MESRWTPAIFLRMHCAVLILLLLQVSHEGELIAVDTESEADRVLRSHACISKYPVVEHRDQVQDPAAAAEGPP